MASTSLDLVRSIYVAAASGEFFGPDFLSRVERAVHPEFEFVVADGPAPGNFTGVAGMEESFRGMLDAWDQWRGEAEEYRELDDERVLVFDRRSGRGKTSGLQITTKGAALFHIQEGKVIRFVSYWERDHAFADLGLSPEATRSD